MPDPGGMSPGCGDTTFPPAVFSYDAIMSNTVGCHMGDVFRAIAPISGMGA
jgi:hypothetical protein